MIFPKKSILNLKPYNSPDFLRKGFIRLDYSENTIGCSNKVIAAFRKLNEEDISIYPNYFGLNEKLAKYAKVNSNQVLATNGSDDALKLIFDSFVDKNQQAIILEPSFSMFELLLQASGAKIKKIRYNENLSFPFKAVLNAINSKTKIVVLCNPNNPTGTLIKKNEIVEILRKARKLNSIVLVDEAYYEFSKGTCSNLINRFDNLIITRTFSKAFGLAALRAGYILSNKNNIDYLKRIYAPFGLNMLAKIAIETSLDDLSYTTKYISEVIRNKKIVRSEFKKLGIKTYPTKSNFIIAKFKDSKLVRDQLKKRGILVRDMSSYAYMDNCLRIAIGTKTQIKKLISNISEILKPALIFDMDGVLVDVSNSYRIAIKKTAEYFTKSEVKLEEIESYKKKPGFNNDWVLTEAIIRSRNLKISFKKIIDRFQEFYIGNKFNGLINNEKWMLDKNLLTRLSKKYKLAIVTGRPKIEAEYALKNNNVINFFPTVIALEDVVNGKPNPEGILLALSLLNSKNAIYFGDTINDELAAKAAKIDFKWIKNNTNKIVRKYL